MLIFFLLSIIISWIVYVRLKLKGTSLQALSFKTLTTVLIIVFASIIIFNNPQNLNLGLIVILALVFGLVGDVMLDLKLIYPKDDSYFTYAGFISFLLGHFLYIGYFLIMYPIALIGYSFIFGLAGMIVFVVLMTENTMRLNYGKFRVISSVYAYILSYIMFLTLWIGFEYHQNGILWFGFGMVSFIISDLILSLSFFGKDEKKWMIIGNYVFYYGAQLMLASSLLWI